MNRGLKRRWEQFLRTGPCCVRPRGEHGSCQDDADGIHWLERRAPRSEPFLLWLDLFSLHGPWDPPQPYRDQYAAVDPDELEAGEEGDLVEETADVDEEIDIEDVPALIDVPPAPWVRY